MNDCVGTDSDGDDEERPRSLMYFAVKVGHVAMAELLVSKGGVDLTANRVRGPEQYQPDEFTYLGLAVHKKDTGMYVCMF